MRLRIFHVEKYFIQRSVAYRLGLAYLQVDQMCEYSLHGEWNGWNGREILCRLINWCMYVCYSLSSTYTALLIPAKCALSGSAYLNEFFVFLLFIADFKGFLVFSTWSPSIIADNYRKVRAAQFAKVGGCFHTSMFLCLLSRASLSVGVSMCSAGR